MISVHELLRSIGVSNESLDRLVVAASEAGAWGAKLSGAGGGGVVLALVSNAATAGVISALAAAGAAAVFEVGVDKHGVELN
jgi:mevalonate kinase